MSGQRFQKGTNVLGNLTIEKVVVVGLPIAYAHYLFNSKTTYTLIFGIKDDAV